MIKLKYENIPLKKECDAGLVKAIKIPLNSRNYIFRPLFGHFLPNFTTTNFSAIDILGGPIFDLFGRIYGHLAIVFNICIILPTK
jgi:hypothetical protein